ncbi:mcfN [Symbiodinium sp. CCMP2592]|nr:mcfN [Symbiodinium sp. CCMP2592]
MELPPTISRVPGPSTRRAPATSGLLGRCAWRLVFLGVCLSQNCPGSGETFLTPRSSQPPRTRLRARSGWRRLNKRASWDFLLGASPFAYEEIASNSRQQEYMKNMLWVDDLETPENQSSPTASVEKYPPAFVAYLARLLLARDERCAGWWAGAKSAGVETPQEVFAQFEASVAKTLSESWRGKAGALAAALIKRFGGRFPFDAEPQIRLCFGLLPEDILRGSFFDQNFSTDRDEVMEVFLAIDKDGNGMLTREEIQEAFQSIGDGWLSKPEVEQMLKDALADSNGEARVDRDLQMSMSLVNLVYGASDSACR